MGKAVLGLDGAARWLYEVAGKKKGYVAALAITQAVLGALGVLFALLLRNVVDNAIAGERDAFWQSVVLAVALVAVQIILTVAVRWLQELGERGSGLSEGQTQCLAIARALFSDCPVLLLDESTSALDESTERRLLENLRSLTDKTVVIVTHRTAALAICDRVWRFTESGIEDVTERSI